MHTLKIILFNDQYLQVSEMSDEEDED